MKYHVQEVDTKNKGAAGVFRYYISDIYHTLAVMFDHDVKDPVSGCCGVFNVKLYPGKVPADMGLYYKMKNDKPWEADGEKRYKDLGSGLEAAGSMTKKTPTVKIDIYPN